MSFSPKRKRSGFGSSISPATKRTKPILGCAEVEGGGKRVFLTKDIGRPKIEAGIVRDYLICNGAGDETSDFFKKFYGTRHKKPIIIEGINYGFYSYQYVGNASIEELAEIMQEQAHCLKDPDGELDESNFAVTVKMYPGIRSMDFVYCDEDIVERINDREGTYFHCDTDEDDDNKKWKRWNDLFNHEELDMSFFFTDSEHASVGDTIAAVKGVCRRVRSRRGLQL